MTVCVDDSNRWIRRVFRVRDNKLEFIEGGDEIEIVEEDKDRAVAQEVQQMPEGVVTLEDVVGFSVLAGVDCRDRNLRHLVSVSSMKHRMYHTGPCKLFLIFKNKPCWRIRVDEQNARNGSAAKLLLCIERCLPRATVVLAGWINARGTINFNRRYTLLFSTGHFMSFKDPSLETMRREMWMGEPGCSVQSLVPVPPPGKEEKTFIENLPKSYGKMFVENLAMRLIHPQISDKRGYVMSIERLTDTESPASHLNRFREWLRVFELDCTPANEDEKRLECLRSSFESVQALERMIKRGAFSPSPALRELGRAGFPSNLRRTLWTGIVAGLTSKTLSLTLYAKPRIPGFDFPFPDDLPRTKLLEYLFHNGHYEFVSDTAKRMAFELLTDRPDVLLSHELIGMANFVDAIFPVKTAGMRFLHAVFSSVFIGYHLNGHATKDFLESMEPRSVVTFSLYIDAFTVIEIVKDVCPSLNARHLHECNDIIRSWLLSGFTTGHLFSYETVARIWDVLVTSIHLETVVDVLIRIAVSIFVCLNDTLGSCETILDFKNALNQSSAVSFADFIIHHATKDRLVLRSAGWRQIKEKRMYLSGSIELEARHRISSIERWMHEVTFLKDMRLYSTMNRWKDNQTISFQIVHRCEVALSASVQSLAGALELSQNVLDQVITKGSNLNGVYHQGLENALDESKGYSNVFMLPGGQVAVQATAVIKVVETAIALGWALCGCLQRCEFLDDCRAYKGMSMLAQRAAQGVRKQSGKYSLAAVAKVSVPTGDPPLVLATSVDGELQRLLVSLLTHLDEICRCVIDTSVGQQQRRTENMFLKSVFISDIFGGGMDTLCQKVPLVMSQVEAIRNLIVAK